MNYEPKPPEDVPYFVFEAVLSRQERNIRRLWIALLVAIAACVAVFAGHVWYLSQYDFVSYDQDGQGVNIIGDGNGVDVSGPAGESTSETEPINYSGQGYP